MSRPSSWVPKTEEDLIEAGFMLPSASTKAVKARQESFFKKLSGISSEKLSERDRKKLEALAKEREQQDQADADWYERRRQEALKEIEQLQSDIPTHKPKAVNLLSTYRKYQEAKDYEREKERKEREKRLEDETKREIEAIKADQEREERVKKRMQEEQKRIALEEYRRLRNEKLRSRNVRSD